MVGDLLSPAMEGCSSGSGRLSIYLRDLYLFTLAKNEAVVCSGYVFLKSVIFWLIWIRRKNSEALWSLAREHAVVPTVMLFFLHIVLKSALGALNVPTQTAGSSEAEPEKPLCLCRVVAVVCSKALDPCTGNYTSPVIITKSLWATLQQAEQCFPELLQATQCSSR